MQIQVEHFKNLVAIAAADGYMSSREREFLADRAKELELSEEEVTEIMAQGDILQYIVPLNMFEREDQLGEAVFMSIIDGRIADQEHQLCLKIAERLDIDKEYVEKMIQKVKVMWGK